MAIDILTLIVLISAAWKGYQRGLIVAIFSFIAIVIGIAAALKFSVVVAAWLGGNTAINSAWLPFVAFILVMIAVVLIVRWLANFLETAIDLVLLGWVNKIGGIILYVFINLLVYSVVLFYATEIGIIRQDTIDASRTYSLIEPWGPSVIEAFGRVFPYFKDMFQQLEAFFGRLASDQPV